MLLLGSSRLQISTLCWYKIAWYLHMASSTKHKVVNVVHSENFHVNAYKHSCKVEIRGENPTNFPSSRRFSVRRDQQSYLSVSSLPCSSPKLLFWTNTFSSSYLKTLSKCWHFWNLSSQPSSLLDTVAEQSLGGYPKEGEVLSVITAITLTSPTWPCPSPQIRPKFGSEMTLSEFFKIWILALTSRANLATPSSGWKRTIRSVEYVCLHFVAYFVMKMY